MAERARNRSASGRAGATGKAKSAVQAVRAATAASTGELREPVLHHRLRLGIASALAGAGALSFGELRDLLNTTDGNLSVHARKLEDAGLVSCSKSFADRRPRSEYQLTDAGRQALVRYLDHMEALIRSARAALPG